MLHRRLGEVYEARVRHVVAEMREWAELTEQVRACLGSREFDRIPALLDRNFDLRCEVCANAVSEKNRRMVELARSVGASAKFTGSGGAIIGTYEDEKMFRRLADVLRNERIDVIKPEIVTSGEIR